MTDTGEKNNNFVREIAAIILENNSEEILLYLRDNKPDIPFPHHWDLFGGHIEEGETPKEALIREVKEELNFDLKDFRFFRKYDCAVGDVYPNRKYIYIGKIDKPIEELSLQEGERLQFFSKDSILDIKFANILKEVIQDYLQFKRSKLI